MSDPNQDTRSASLRLDSLRLSNYRCFASLDISFEHDLTVLVANNGQGKTAVLDAAATALGAFVGAFDEGKDRSFSKDDIRLLHAATGNRRGAANNGRQSMLETTYQASHVIVVRSGSSVMAAALSIRPLLIRSSFI